MGHDEEYGYLKATVENNTLQVERLTDMFMEHAKKEEERTEEIMVQIQALKDELNVYKTIVRVGKVIGSIAILILTLKFGEIEDLWKSR